MGDLVHTFPAIDDALRAIEDLEITWLVEEDFVDIAHTHAGVKTVLPICFRRFLAKPLSNRAAFFSQIRALRAMRFDQVLDAQGLIKSGFISRLSGCAIRNGLDSNSAREGLAALFYTHVHTVSRAEHAIDRTRRLFASALHYPLPEPLPGTHAIPAVSAESVLCATSAESTVNVDTGKPYAVFLHGTTWQNKRWPVTFWQELASTSIQAGYTVKIPAGNPEELSRAERITSDTGDCQILDRVPLARLVQICARASFVVSVDTGLGHLAGALGVPVVGLYGPTNSVLTGIRGTRVKNLQADFACAPCMQRKCAYAGEVHRNGQAVIPACFSMLTPEVVWHEVQRCLEGVPEEC